MNNNSHSAPTVATRRAALAGLGTGVLTFVLAARSWDVLAQEATPGAGEIQTQFLSAGAVLADLPYVPASVALARITFGPHSEGTPGPDPFASFTLVESGTITLQADQAVTIIPGEVPGGAEEPVAEAPRVTEPGVPMEVRAGESFLMLPGISFQISNPGTEPAEMLLVIFQA